MFKRVRILALTALIVSTSAFAGVDTETDSNDVILAGHDAVAYFTENKPVLGSTEYTATYNGAIYRFASAENRDTFKAIRDRRSGVSYRRRPALRQQESLRLRDLEKGHPGQHTQSGWLLARDSRHSPRCAVSASSPEPARLPPRRSPPGLAVTSWT